MQRVEFSDALKTGQNFDFGCRGRPRPSPHEYVQTNVLSKKVRRFIIHSRQRDIAAGVLSIKGIRTALAVGSTASDK